MNRKLILFTAMSVMLAACSTEQMERFSDAGLEIDITARTYRASFYKDADTRTYIDSEDALRWTADDRISVFAGTTDNLQYVFEGETGDKTGIFAKVASNAAKNGSALPTNYAVYPYSSTTSINSDGIVAYEFPDVQNYTEASISPGSYTMVAVMNNSEDDDFVFRNVCGTLVVKLYGDYTVTSVTLSGNLGEKLSGSAEIIPSIGYAPEVNMAADAKKAITLDCGDGIALGRTADTATEFWFSVPPVDFESGFSIKVSTKEGGARLKSTLKSYSVVRNMISTTEAFCVDVHQGKYLKVNKTTTVKVTDILSSLVPVLSSLPSIISGASSMVTDVEELTIKSISYLTPGPDGSLVEASGAIAYPSGCSSVDKLISLQHGTCDISLAPSRQGFSAEMMPVLKKGVTSVLAMADYLGYGDSQTADLQHPYVHNGLTGSCCADFISAVEEYLQSPESGISYSPSTIDLIGYSQGGAATISTLFELEKRNMGGRIGEVLAGAGPHDLSAFINRFISNPASKFPYSGFLAYFLRGLVYGDCLEVDFHNIFAPEVFENGSFDKFSTTMVNSWHERLGNDVTKIFNEDFFKNNPSDRNDDVNTLMASIYSNSIINVTKPQNVSKISLWHCAQDNIVPYECSINLHDAWPETTMTTLDTTSDHIKGGTEFYLRYLNESLWNLVKAFI